MNEHQRLEDFTKEKSEEISINLQRKLGPEYLSQRPGPSGLLTYIEGHRAISIANDIFGFNGWSSEIRNTTVDFIDTNEEGRINLGISATVRVTLKDGAFHEDIGYGCIENCRSKAMAFEKAKKQAITDATKRALRSFGNALGNCVYDKAYLSGISKMARPTIKFAPQGLYRHPQIEAAKKEQEEAKKIEDNKHQAETRLNNNRRAVQQKEPRPVSQQKEAETLLLLEQEERRRKNQNTYSVVAENSGFHDGIAKFETSSPTFLREPLIAEDSFDENDEILRMLEDCDQSNDDLLFGDQIEVITTSQQSNASSNDKNSIKRTPSSLSDSFPKRLKT